ncbi:PD-(D/E)XK nuclease family protein [SAR202 cluster bacterium AC-409-J13_OGT_754m]|nr:PD-(D/E)XK nuclease family protein [SAR202 cluster bacterium AC-409-J13_OGT_754m]
MPEERVTPYIWVSWLTKLMVGESMCEWAAWFKAWNESWSYKKMPSDFDSTTWKIHHTSLLNKVRNELESKGKSVFVENQNKFTLRGKLASLGGKPDIITTTNGLGTIYDVKTGNPSPSHHVQLMIYMYAIPRAMKQYNGISFEGKVIYEDHELVIPSDAVDTNFINNLANLILRIASNTPAKKVPSIIDCSFCNLTDADCPEKMQGKVPHVGSTKDF